MKRFQSRTAWFFIESRLSILRVAFGSTVGHKIDHTSGLERGTRKIETCGPTSVVYGVPFVSKLNFYTIFIFQGVDI